MENSREIFEALVKYSHNFEYWNQYLTIERYISSLPKITINSRYLGSVSATRNLYKKAYQQVHDYPERIWEDWLQFERETGTFEQYDFANQKIQTRKREVDRQR